MGRTEAKSGLVAKRPMATTSGASLPRDVSVFRSLSLVVRIPAQRSRTGLPTRSGRGQTRSTAVTSTAVTVVATRPKGLVHTENGFDLRWINAAAEDAA